MAQSYDYSDSVLIVASDAGYSLFEIAVTDLDTYHDMDGVLIDYVDILPLKHVRTLATDKRD